MSKLSILKQKNKRDVDMTQGSIFRHLITFAFPLLIGNIFQQLYNTVDTWVVGNYVSNEAFSAVGTVGPVINMLIGIFLGLSSGAGVVISQYYGAKRYDKVRDTVHTSIVMTLILAVLFTIIGIAMIPFVLNFMKTPAEVMPESSAYLTIYFAGVIGLMLYNMGAGILRAVGDSKRPFYFLVVSAVLNIILDLVFVLSLGMGVEGVAYATIISQGVSAMLTMITLFRTDSCIKVELKYLKLDKEMLAKIVRVGIRPPSKWRSPRSRTYLYSLMLTTSAQTVCPAGQRTVRLTSFSSCRCSLSRSRLPHSSARTSASIRSPAPRRAHARRSSCPSSQPSF